MNKFFLLVLLSLSLTACDQIAPLVPSPSPVVVETATLPPSPLPPTLTPAPTAATAPFIQSRVSLRDVVGTGRAPVAAAALGTKLYVANRESNNVAIIQDNRVVAYIPVGKRPSAIAADAENRRVYVANYDDKTISLISNDKVTLTENIAGSSWSLVYLDNHLFVGLDWDARILVLNPTTLKTESILQSPGLSLGVNLRGDSVRHHLYLNLYDKIGIVDSATLKPLTAITTKGYFTAIVPDPLKGRVLASVHESGASTYVLIAFDTSSGKEVGRVKIGAEPGDAILSIDGERLYIANTDTDDITVVDLRRMAVRGNIAVGMSPRALVMDATSPRLYVVNEDSDNVSVIDTSAQRVSWTLPLGMFPTALLANEATNRVYVASASTDSVFIIQGGKLVKEIGVGHHPIDLALDVEGKRVFIADAADGTISLINEADDGVHVSQTITRPLTTVAVDPSRTRLFAGGVILDLKTLLPSGSMALQAGYNRISPYHIRVSPTGDNIYALGWNGGNGTNSGTGLYALDPKTLETRGLLDYAPSTTAFTVDPLTNRVFLTRTASVTGSNALIVFDANGKSTNTIALDAVTTGMVYNPDTKHLFLSHGMSAPNTANAAENEVEVLDGTSFGTVARLKMDSPGKMTRLGNTIYVADRQSGIVTLIQDVATAVPPAPTLTLTPTPVPTLPPPTGTSTATPTLTATPTVSATRVITPPLTVTRTASVTPTRTITGTRPVTATTTLTATRSVSPTATVTRPAPRPTACTQTIAAPFTARLTTQVISQLGCATEQGRTVRAASQTFEGGVMFWIQDIKAIYILYFDGTWQFLEDTWTEGTPDDSCPTLSVQSGLIKPRRGFGKVWCEQAGARARLGAATANEVGPYSVPLQRFERGLVFSRDTGQVLVLTADGVWR